MMSARLLICTMGTVVTRKVNVCCSWPQLEDTVKYLLRGRCDPQISFQPGRKVLPKTGLLWKFHLKNTFFSLRLRDKEGVWRSHIGGQRVVGLVEPFGDGVDLPVLRLSLQPDLCLLSCSVVLATKSRQSSGARIGFTAASMILHGRHVGHHPLLTRAGGRQKFSASV